MSSKISIDYIDTTFDDVVNECCISSMSTDMRINIARVFNTFKKAVGFDHEWEISKNHENMIALAYFKLFMSVIHGYHAYLMKNMESENGYPSDIPSRLNIVLTSFCSATYSINHKLDEHTWEDLESNLPIVRDTTNAFLNHVYKFIAECDAPKEDADDDIHPIPPNPRRYIPDEEEESDEEKIKHLKSEIRMKLIKAKYRYDDLRMYLNVALTVLVYFGWLCLLARVFFAITVVSTDKYQIDDNRLAGYFIFMLFMHLIANIRVIYNMLRRMANGH